MKVKWGVIGAGGIARRRTIPEGLMQARNAELVAVMDVAPGLAEEVAAEFGGKAAYADEEGLLGHEGLDAVYIASPAHLHLAQFSRAVAAGKHVLVEKPLAHTAEFAQVMADLAAASGVKCAEGYMMKYHPLHQHAREVAQSGRLGTPVCVRGQLSCWYPPIEGAWRQIPELGGGGALVDMASHIYDLFQYILGSPIVQVMAMCENVAHEYPVEDSATTLARFENGCQGIIDTFFNIPDEACPRVMEIYGTSGSILAEGTIGQGGGCMRECLMGEVGGYDADQARTDETGGFTDVEPGEYNMYRAEVEAFSQAILDDRPIEMNSLADGVQIMRIVGAAYRSAKTGQRVDL